MRERYAVTKAYVRDRSKQGVKEKKMYAIVDKKHPLSNDYIAPYRKKKFKRISLPEIYETREEAQKECDRLNQLNLNQPLKDEV